MQQKKVSTQQAAEILKRMTETLHKEMETDPELRKKYKAAEKRLSPLMGDALEPEKDDMPGR